jgi:hypothetical protein
MAIDLLNNCNFDLTRIKKLFIGSILIDSTPISYPIYYNTFADGTDSIIAYSTVDMSTIIIGGQEIVMDEVLSVEDNITFNEELVIDSRSKNYKKTITYEISGIDLDLVNKTENITIDNKSKILAILIDENDNELIVGYDNPLTLETINSGIDGDINNIVVTLTSSSKSRARNTQRVPILPPVIPSPSVTFTPSNTRTPSLTPSLSVSASFGSSVSATPNATPSVTPTFTPTRTITPSSTISRSITPTMTRTPGASQTTTPTITPSIGNSPSITQTITMTPTPTPLVGTPFTTEWTVSGDTSARTISLPCYTGYWYDDSHLSGYTFNAYVDWGDGSLLSHISAYNDMNRIHTYSSNGIYQVKIYGEFPAIAWNRNATGFTENQKLTDIINWGDSNGFGGFSYMDFGFYHTNIKSTGVGKILSKIDLLSIDVLFRDCSLITAITPNLLDNCIYLTSISDTFDRTSISTIPADLFKFNTGVTSFNEAFWQCESLTSIPNDLFKYNINATQIAFTFIHCISLTGISYDTFINNTNVLSFAGLFSDCQSLTTIPSDLFKYNVNVLTFGETFQDCINLATVPDELFKYNTKCTDFGFTFLRCNKLQINPLTFCLSGETNTRFYNQSINFCDTFARDLFTGIQGTAPDLWNYNYGTGTTTSSCFGEGTFYGSGNTQTSISNYCDIPAGWGAIACPPSPTPTASSTPSVTPTISISASITPSITPTQSSTPSLTITPTPSSSFIPSQTPTQSITSSVTPTISISTSNTPSMTPTISTSNSPSASITPTRTNSVTPTQTATITPTPTPTVTPLAGTPFTTEWTVSGDATARTITLPLHVSGGTFNATIVWGDGSGDSTVTSFNDANRIHTYSSNGTYQVQIYGECPGWSFNSAGDRLKITDIINWGDSIGFGGFAYLNNGFSGCSNLKSAGNLNKILAKAGLTDLQSLFANAGITGTTSTIFDNCINVTTFNNAFFGCASMTSIPDGLLRNNISSLGMHSVFQGCNALQINPWTFYFSGETGTRFLNQSVDFINCFNRTSFSGIQGTAPDLWNCSYGTGTPSTAGCFTNAGNSQVSISNYCDIPTAWGTIVCSVTPSLTPSISPTPSPSATVTPTITVSNSMTPSVTPTITSSITASVTPTITKSNSVTPSVTPTITVSNSISVSATITSSVTPTITVSNSVSPSITPSVTPTITKSTSVTPSPVSRSVTPSVTPTITKSNSVTPSKSLTPTRSISISKTPSRTPTPTISDKRLKKDIILIGKSLEGINIYQFEYVESLGIPGVYQGVMAQELFGTKFEDAVSINQSTGFYQVNYYMTDVEFRRVL